MADRETKAQVQKRILEAEKVVLSSTLYRWKRDWGMDYIIVVHNRDQGSVFDRYSIDADAKQKMITHLKEVLADLEK